MNEIKLVEPAIEYAEDLWAFRQEILDYDKENGDQFAGCLSLRESKSAEEWINLCSLRKSPETVSQSGAAVPSHMYLAVRKSDNRIVGGIDLRHHIDHPILGTWGGHCGYSVRPSERGKGYAKEMLRLNILNAAKLGIDKMLVICDAENKASEKTILANGGVFEKTIDVDGETMKRFWITVNKGMNPALIELDDSYLPQMAALYRESFAGEPWNDDWSDTDQLYEYIKDVSSGQHALNYGLLIDGKLEGISLGKISHWWEGTNYNIEEFCVSPACQGQGLGSMFLDMIEQQVRAKGLAGIFLQTDNDKPSYHFYHKNGFQDLDTHISLYKSVKAGKKTLEENSSDNSSAGGQDVIIYDIANLNDIPELVRLRIAYMIDDFGSITDEEREGMEKQLPGYFERELGKKLIAFVARAEGRLVAAAYLLIIEKPANPFFLNGLDSEVLSVYTEDGYRGKGICTKLMKNMIDYASEHKISRIDLVSTDDGYPIYKKLGFEDRVQKYKDMRFKVIDL